jgi:hypothetical protein
VLHVLFVTNEENALLADPFLQGFVQIVIAPLDGRLICQIKHTNTPLRSFVIGGGQCPEFFLSRSVPDLQRTGFAIDGGRVGFEVDSYGWKVGWVEFWLAQSEEDGTLADCLRTHDYYFEGFALDIWLGLVHFAT